MINRNYIMTERDPGSPVDNDVLCTGLFCQSSQLFLLYTLFSTEKGERFAQILQIGAKSKINNSLAESSSVKKEIGFFIEHQYQSVSLSICLEKSPARTPFSLGEENLFKISSIHLPRSRLN